MTEKAQQYREVRRKAAVGERIKIVDGGVRFSSGSVFVVEDADFPWGGDDRDGTGVAIDGGKPLFHRRYVVLEPIAQLIAEPAPVSPLTSDPLYASFRQFVADNAPALRKLLDEVDPEPTVVAAPVIPKLTRAQVIAKARADVAEMQRVGMTVFTRLDGDSPFSTKYFAVKFHVNRDKRTVTALVYEGRSVRRGEPDAKFTAKCSPADVFHADLGRAIALRKALGLTVPSEYTDAPQPEKAEVGAVVLFEGIRVTARPSSDFNVNYRKGTAQVGAGAIRKGVLIDDTDVDYSGDTAQQAA
ncbi:hypothetical protein G5B47_02260 [Paenibacillus sp. 7124]|uniref:Uncharacterized protein n=1 Tax=Paenibacillus apii TaxID=1850370 RepID=A0A6M1PLL8_9BACL|nr:hypothetical protein [Paenibacillus apii]NGM81231.1 hypothetical protein [Paenibacillus apii]